MSELSTPGALPISTLTGSEVERIDGSASMQALVEELVRDEVGALVVGSADTIQGIVSERDVVRALARGGDPATLTVADIATSADHLVWCDASSTIAEVGEMMLERYLRHILVREDGELVGLVSARDLLGIYAASESL